MNPTPTSGGRTRLPPLDPGILLANLPSAVLTVDGEMRVRSANPACEQLFSSSANFLSGRDLADLLAPHATILELIRQARQSGSSISEYGVELALPRGQVVSVD